ncbi:MAG: hypothetical protein KatS3mg120_2647 [Erythrobacter sp.]|nr:MAG: hypothetical protein KatS3mg120_2647 [Erythrobacter sp.]
MAIAAMLATLLVLPFAAALAIALVGGATRAVHSGLAAAASALGLALLGSLAPAVLSGAVMQARWDWVPSLGLDLALMVDPLGLMFAALILGIGLLVALYAHFYLYPGEASGRFFASLMLFQGAMLGIVIAGNVLLLLVFWELTSLASFLLIGFWQHRPEARQGARLALAITGGGGLALIGGLVLLGLVAGSVSTLPRSSRAARRCARRRSIRSRLALFSYRLLHQVSAVPLPLLAAPRHGRAHAGERLSALGHDGEGGGVPAGAAVAGARRDRALHGDGHQRGPRHDDPRRRRWRCSATISNRSSPIPPFRSSACW